MRDQLKYRPIPQEYFGWIQERLHGETITVNLNGYYLGDNRRVYCEQDKSNEPAPAYCATSEEDLKLWLLKRTAEDAGQELELRMRPVEALKWRYVWDEEKTEPGHVVLKEQKNYIYNVEYDSRKWWMEYVLKCLKPVCEEEYYCHVAEEYSDCMNLWFETSHWVFDYNSQEFREITGNIKGLK